MLKTYPKPKHISKPLLILLVGLNGFSHLFCIKTAHKSALSITYLLFSFHWMQWDGGTFRPLYWVVHFSSFSSKVQGGRWTHTILMSNDVYKGRSWGGGQTKSHFLDLVGGLSMNLVHAMVTPIGKAPRHHDSCTVGQRALCNHNHYLFIYLQGTSFLEISDSLTGEYGLGPSPSQRLHTQSWNISAWKDTWNCLRYFK